MKQLAETGQKEPNLSSNYLFIDESMKKKTQNHPCYNGCAHESARIHLSVAPKCNIQCNYCIRKYDCVNESRPGVTTKVLSPEEALQKYILAKKEMPNLTVVGIAGPGDALANFEHTKETIRKIKEYDADITFCLSTNGLMLPMYAEELIALGVSHVTVTINSVDPLISAKIYRYIKFQNLVYTGVAAGKILLKNQLEGLKILIENQIVCKVNIVTLKGINDLHIPEIVKKMKDLGCYITNIMPFIPVQGSGFENLPKYSNEEIMKIREECDKIMLQMYHCRQCRADAVGTLW